MSMPAPASSTNENAIWIVANARSRRLVDGVNRTLPLVRPPLPTSTDSKEAATIDKLTLPAIYSYNYQQLQDASALLVLNPFQT